MARLGGRTAFVERLWIGGSNIACVPGNNEIWYGGCRDAAQFDPATGFVTKKGDFTSQLRFQNYVGCRSRRTPQNTASIFCKLFLFKELNFTKRTPLR